MDSTFAEKVGKNSFMQLVQAADDQQGEVMIIDAKKYQELSKLTDTQLQKI